MLTLFLKELSWVLSKRKLLSNSTVPEIPLDDVDTFPLEFATGESCKVCEYLLPMRRRLSRVWSSWTDKGSAERKRPLLEGALLLF